MLHSGWRYLWFGVALMGFAAGALAGDGCQIEQYFSPDEFPLDNPHTEFVRTRNAAKRGNPLEQRNLAVSYESGYLVSQCQEKAGYWYRKAAKKGDELARRWVARQDAFAAALAGPECYESNCNLFGNEGGQTLSLISGSGGHYFADVTVNGITVNGMVDTGATTLSISAATANKLQIPIAGKAGIATTANGNTAVVVKTLPSVKIGSIVLGDVMVSIRPVDGPTLIGMSILNRLRMVAAAGQMTLSR